MNEDIKVINKNGSIDFEVVKNLPYPELPPSRVIREHSTRVCPICSSSVYRKFFIGKLVCAREECEFNH